MVVSKYLPVQWIFAMLILVPFFLYGDDVQINSGIDSENIYENHPLRGLITITHPENLEVDKTSFRLDSKPLKTDLVKNTKISPPNPLTITIYEFEIPGKPKGLYVLPEISVVVGGKEYKSIPSTYEISGTEAPPPPQAAPAAPSAPPPQPATAPTPTQETQPKPQGPVGPSLKLEAMTEGNNPLYPGQRLRFVYRYYYTGDIDLSREVLPLLDAEGFLKIGDKDFKNYAQGQTSINEISQTVEAVKPGEYSFGPSLAEGHAYVNQDGQRSYSKEVLKSEASPVKVTVKDFPENDKPASFNGSVGNFAFDVALKSPSEVNVGDEMTLAVNITGKESLHAAKLPEICCQPGFTGFFRLGDLPPAGEVNGDVKNYTVKLRPLTDIVKAIPSVEFSYFDPQTEQYTVLNSKPIPITVKPSEPLPVENLDKGKKLPAESQAKGPLSPIPPRAIEIESNFPLGIADLYNKMFGTWWSLLVVPIGIALLIYQSNLRHSLLRRKMEAQTFTSAELFAKAFQEKSPTPLFFDLLNKSLKQGLVEAGEIPQMDIATEDIPSTGVSGDVRTFLSSVDEKRFTGQGNVTPSFLQGPAQTLFERIQDIRRGSDAKPSIE